MNRLGELAPIQELEGLSRSGLTDELLTRDTPWVARGLMADWPMVKAGQQGARHAREYLLQFYQGITVGTFSADAKYQGRYFYNEAMDNVNFERAPAKLDQVFTRLQQLEAESDPSSLYVGSTTIDNCLPGFRQHNDVDLGERDALATIWMGNRSTIAAHYDLPDNLACVVAGRRRFTLFPPEQLENLYVGPLDFTPAGQSISLVDFDNPDFERFPKFREALANAQTVELEPGDAVFIPAMWWHHVKASTVFNVLINYWWRQSPAFMSAPHNALQHALMDIRALPKAQRKAWKAFFDYYIFEADESTHAHIPHEALASLGELDAHKAMRLRALLLNKLKR
ncbi:cupin-like domain-containing protein [Paraferrimonas sedimenticola]|uniref:Cupin n=1 Tax=Paraferrimonas sedimenticola TaxID=375674 RepID=A0AA37RYD3_9GAMM|nr:cupin-like domain-containing protein [Paraferrimonas sedimenticola]GLP97635.1 cupin [Paraferrimonas sedimenticola]